MTHLDVVSVQRAPAGGSSTRRRACSSRGATSGRRSRLSPWKPASRSRRCTAPPVERPRFLQRGGGGRGGGGRRGGRGGGRGAARAPAGAAPGARGGQRPPRPPRAAPRLRGNPA